MDIRRVLGDAFAPVICITLYKCKIEKHKYFDDIIKKISSIKDEANSAQKGRKNVIITDNSKVVWVSEAAHNLLVYSLEHLLLNNYN